MNEEKEYRGSYFHEDLLLDGEEQRNNENLKPHYLTTWKPCSALLLTFVQPYTPSMNIILALPPLKLTLPSLSTLRQKQAANRSSSLWFSPAIASKGAPMEAHCGINTWPSSKPLSNRFSTIPQPDSTRTQIALWCVPLACQTHYIKQEITSK